LKTNLDCIPCFLRQAVMTAKDLNLNEDQAQALIRRTLELSLQMDWSVPPPLMGRDVHRLIREMTGDKDPYLAKKITATERALSLLPEMESAVAGSSDPFLTAVKLSIAGNVIDLGVATGASTDIKKAMQDALTATVNQQAVDSLRRAIQDAGDILFLTDNTGEIVFDLPLLEHIGSDKVTVAVRGSPTINDATMEDARRSGLTDRFRVITNGTDIPGTWLDECSDEFVREFEAADLVLSKGQGNFETLNDNERRLFFLFLVKCATVSRMTGEPVGSFMVLENPS